MGEVVSAELSDLVPIEVLLKRSAHRNVDHLLAAADAHHGQVLVAGLREEAELGVVELAVDRPDLGVRLLSVEGGVHVPTTRQQKAIDVGERRGPRRQVDRLRAHRLDRPLVRHVVLGAATRTGGDSDTGPLFTGHGFTDKITGEHSGFVKNVPK